MSKIYTVPEHRIIKAKYGGQCDYCTCYFPAGVPIYWNPVTKEKYHRDCLNKKEE